MVSQKATRLYVVVIYIEQICYTSKVVHISRRWQNIPDKLLANSLQFSQCYSSNYREAVKCLSLFTYIKERVCNPERDYLWHIKDPPTFEGLCGYISLTSRFEQSNNEQGRQITFSVKPLPEMGVNLTFAEISIRMDEGRCEVESLHLVIGTKREIICGHLVNWFFLSEAHNINVRYTTLSSGMVSLRGRDSHQHVAFIAFYQVVNTGSSGTQSEWLSFRAAYLPTWFNFSTLLLPKPSELILTSAKNNWTQNLIDLSRGKIMLHPSAGLWNFGRNVITSQLLIMADYSSVIKVVVDAGSCTTVDVYNGLHQYTQPILTISHTNTMAEATSSAFAILIKLLHGISCNNRRKESITISYELPQYKEIHIANEDVNLSLPFHQNCSIDSRISVCHIKVVSWKINKVHKFIQTEVTNVILEGLNYKGCLYRGIAILNYNIKERSKMKTWSAKDQYRRHVLSPHFVLCDVSYTWESDGPVLLPSKLTSNRVELYLVFYHYKADSQFQANINIKPTDCPGYNIYCGTYKDLLSGTDLGLTERQIDSNHYKVMLRKELSPPFAACPHKRLMEDRLMAMCAGRRKGFLPYSVALLSNPLLPCFSVQYFAYTQNPSLCNVEVHSAEWQDIYLNISLQNRRIPGCQNINSSEGTISGQKYVTFKPKCSIINI